VPRFTNFTDLLPEPNVTFPDNFTQNPTPSDPGDPTMSPTFAPTVAPTTEPPTPAPAQVVLSGDPHIKLRNGTILQFWMPLARWLPLLEGPEYELLGKAFGRPGTSEQWFDGLAVRKKSALDNPNVEVTIPCAVPLDAAAGDSKDDAIHFVELVVDGARVTESGRVYQSDAGAVQVAASRYDLHKVTGVVENDMFIVKTPDFTFKLRTMTALKYDDAEERDDFLHLDFEFVAIPDASALSGFLAEVMTDAPLSDPSTFTLDAPPRVTHTSPGRTLWTRDMSDLTMSDHVLAGADGGRRRGRVGRAGPLLGPPPRGRAQDHLLQSVLSRRPPIVDTFYFFFPSTHNEVSSHSLPVAVV